MGTRKKLTNIVKYGVGPRAKERKRAERALKLERKHQARVARFEDSSRWQQDGAFVRRNYVSYDDYLSHQASKLHGIIGRLHETQEEDYAEFFRRFESCSALSGVRSVLCLGARLGTEVRALHALGYFAVGIDLNPGENNSRVLPGDFHRLVFPDQSVDVVYTNCLDHVFDLDKVLSEICRVLKDRGVFLTDLEAGYEEGFIPGEFEASHWQNTETLLKTIGGHPGLSFESVGDLGQHRRDTWTQAVFRKLD